ncbi:MAG: AMP-binding protein [Wenzhouxiangellaceae bacterium]|nr:AMP-binding protein [Wenzhouxiangellaceae bacterium]
MSPWLEQRARSHPDDLALVIGERAMSYAELAARSRRLASLLAARGIGKSKIVALEASSTLQSVCWIHAVFWLGATLLPFSPRLPQAARRQLLLEQQVDAVVTCDPDFDCRFGQAGGCVLEMDPELPPGANDAPAATVDAQDLLTILMTSGSTAAARAVPASLANHLASTRAIAERLALSRHDRWLLCLPLDHIGGLAILIRAVITGSSVLLCERFEPESIRRQLASQAVTLSSMVPTMLLRLLETTGGPIESRLRALLIGGAPANPSLLERARLAGLPVVPTYGMTEACSQLATLSPSAASGVNFSASPGLAGRPLPGVEIRILAAGEQSTDPTPTGKVLARGPMLCRRYRFSADRRAPGSNDSAFGSDGWFDTGDLGFVDGMGQLHIVDRVGDRIISGGINVSARQVELALLASGLVAEAAVLGLDHPHWGQQVVAVVTPGPAQAESRESPAATDQHHELVETLQQWSRSKLEPAARPARWRVVESIPRSSSGKPVRVALQELFSRPAFDAQSGFSEVDQR